MKTFITLAVLLFTFMSCETNSLESNEKIDLKANELRVGGVGVGVGVGDVDKDVVTHTKVIHYKVTIVPGNASNNWQSTYHYTKSTGVSGTDCAGARTVAINNMMSGAIITWEKPCVH